MCGCKSHDTLAILVYSAQIRTSQQCFYALRPGLNLAFRCFQMVAAVGIELHLHLAGGRCAGAGSLHVLDDMARPAAVGHKRNHSLAGEVLLMEESLDCRVHTENRR